MSRLVFSLALAGLAVITQLTSAQFDFECPEADGLFAHEQTNLFCLLRKEKKQTKQIRSFVFWENLRPANLLSVLSDL